MKQTFLGKYIQARWVDQQVTQKGSLDFNGPSYDFGSSELKKCLCLDVSSLFVVTRVTCYLWNV